MTDTAVPTGQQPAYSVQPTPRPKRVVELGVAALSIAIIAALALGFAGGLASHALFPAQQGAAGATGKQGAVGQTGAAGPAGSAANINLSNIGYCVSVDNVYSGTLSYVQDLSIYAPTLTNGTQSCPTGTFTPLQPTSGSGQ
jgi:hypothetical protein